MTRAILRTATRARPRRRDQQGGLEGAAAEFALLTQRRARLSRQVELLDRQRRAADLTLAQVQARLCLLQARLAKLLPDAVARDAQPASNQAAPNQPTPARRRGLVLEY